MAGWSKRNGSSSCSSVFGAVFLTCLISSAWALRVSQTPPRQSAPTPNYSQYQSTQTLNRGLLSQQRQQQQSLLGLLLQEQKGMDTEVSPKCRVEESDRVSCGKPETTAAECEAIDCCFHGGQCYYGKAVTVQCTRDGQFVVVVAKDATDPELSLDSVSLLEGNDSSCGPTYSTEKFIVFQFLVSACGTTVMEEDGFLVYENQMSSSYEVAMGPRGSISRDSSYELLFQCRYSASAVEAVVAEVNAVPPPESVVASGPLRVELRLASGQCSSEACNEDEMAYNSFYTEEDYPVTKVMRDPVYVEVRVLERTDPNLVLQLGNCWATSSPDPLSLPQWDLLVNGCPYEGDQYLTRLLPVTTPFGLPNPSHYKRFVMKMFTFVDDDSMVLHKDKIYIHCSTAVCHPTATETCEQTCRRQRRAAPGLHKEANGATVSSGEVRIIDAKALH